jgi:hypothetical protein
MRHHLEFAIADLSVDTRRIEHMFDTAVAELAPTELVLAIADSQRQESMLVARRMADIAELLAQRTDEVEPRILIPAS